MDDVAALELLESLTDKAARREAARSLPVAIMTLLVAAQHRLAKGEEPADDEPDAIWSLLSRLLAEADGVERDLIRFLMYESEEQRHWQDVADLSAGKFATRQAAHKRWKRLTDLGRRTTTRDMRRGAALPRPASVVDTTTPTA